MRLDPTGILIVKPRERLTITISNENTPYQVGEPVKPCGGQWVSRQGPKPRILVFDAPAAGVCALVFSFRFIPDATGEVPKDARYDVSIKGDPGEDTFTESITPPPVDQAVAYNFKVVVS